MRPASLTSQAIEVMACDLAREKKFDWTNGSIREFAEQLGADVNVPGVSHGHGAQSGDLVIYRQYEFEIFLSPLTGLLRDNFTIAHEIGHLRLHIQNWGEEATPDNPIYVSRYLPKYADYVNTDIATLERLERQANRFAAALLMPEDDIREAFNRLDSDSILPSERINRLAGLFKVTKTAIRVRLASLGLIPNF